LSIEVEYIIVALMEEESMIRMMLREVPPFLEGSSEAPPKIRIERILKSEEERAAMAVAEGMTEGIRRLAEEGLMPQRSFVEVSMYIKQEQYEQLGSPPLHSRVKLTFEVVKEET
jgi:hypothetical protein